MEHHINEMLDELPKKYGDFYTEADAHSEYMKLKKQIIDGIDWQFLKA